MGQALISVIIPCYNVEQYIDRCIQSLVKQTIGIKNLELIFINDASTDHTYDKLCEWERKYPDSILLINNTVNLRQGGARNIGISYASADYIGFVDSDDWIDPTMYEKMYQIVKQHDVDVVCVLHQREDIHGKIYHEEHVYQGPKETVYRFQDMSSGLPGGIWSKLYRKQIILENEVYFPEHLAYEDNYWVSILRYYLHTFYVIDEILYHYFVNLSSTLMSQNASHHTDRLQIELLTRKELQKRGFYEKNKAKLDFLFLKVYYVNTLHIFFTKYQDLPYDTILLMQEEVAKQVPDFMNNPYLHELSELELLFLKTAGMSLQKEEFEDIAAIYRKAIIDYNNSIS